MTQKRPRCAEKRLHGHFFATPWPFLSPNTTEMSFRDSGWLRLSVHNLSATHTENSNCRTTAGKYASQRFTASYAAQPKGCSACCVPRPQNQSQPLNQHATHNRPQCSYTVGLSAVREHTSTSTRLIINILHNWQQSYTVKNHAV